MKAGKTQGRACGRRLRAALLGPLLVLALAAPAAVAQGGHLDRDFGHGGKLTIPTKLLGPGRGGLAINRLTARGKVDGRFGDLGAVEIPFTAAESGSASAVIVDGAGRIVVAGSLSTGDSEESEFIGIARYLP